MADDQLHRPVLLQEAIEALNVTPGGRYIDCTFGRGGHSQGILNILTGNGELIALDQDMDAVKHAQKEFSRMPGFRVFHASFAGLARLIDGLGLLRRIDGILIDLGVSSPQLDSAQRGFSFRESGTLDMRMDQSQATMASDWLRTASVEEMSWVFRTYGEEKYAGRIARRIAQERTERPILETQQLARLISECVPAGQQRIHPATRVFQAIRIQVNDELGALEKVLLASIDVLKKGGRLVVISFHSLEDRMVKRFLRGEPEAIALRRLPVAPVKQAAFRTVGKLIRPTEEEQRNNPRSRSARMRVGERLS